MNIVKSYKMFLISLLIISSSCAQSNSSYSTLKATINEAVEKKIDVTLRNRKGEKVVEINFKEENMKIDIKSDAFIINNFNVYNESIQFVIPYSSIECLAWTILPQRLYNEEYINYRQALDLYQNNKLPFKYGEGEGFEKWWKSLKLKRKKTALKIKLSF